MKKRKDKISIYNPEDVASDDSFPRASYEYIEHFEENNFWFKCRSELINCLLNKYFLRDDDFKMLEIGCGLGYVARSIKTFFPKCRVTGSDINIEALDIAKRRIPDIIFLQFNAEKQIPFNLQFDVVGAFDVLEHINDDRKTLLNIRHALKKDGYLILSVPQYQFLWCSVFDVSHKRRYSKKDIENKLLSSGFSIEYLTSYVFAAFPFMLAARFISKIRFRKQTGYDKNHTTWEVRFSSIFNSIFSYLMKIDSFLIKNGMKLPYGGSLIIVARKTC